MPRPYRKILIDKNHEPGHYFGGTRSHDEMIGNGTGGVVIFAGDGDDIINPGIIPPWEERVQIYGGVSLPGFGHPEKLTYKGKGSIGSLDNDGDDFLHGGGNVTAVGGSGNDTYIHHGRSTKESPFILSGFDGGSDVLIFDHSDDRKFGGDGWKLAGYSLYDNYDNGDGTRTAHIKTAMIQGASLNPIVQEQWTQFQFSDRERGDHTPFLLEYEPGEFYDTLHDYFKDAASAGGDVDQYIF